MFDDDDVFAVIISFPPTSGRMRYAPTPVRLISWLNTVNHYTCSMGIMAFSGGYIISFLFIPDGVSFRYTAVLYTTKWGIESLSTPFINV